MEDNQLFIHFKTYKNLLRLLSDRGYLINDFELNLNYKEFCAIHGDQFLNGCSNLTEKFSFLVRKKENPLETLLVLIPKEDTVKIEVVKKAFVKMNQMGINSAMVIYSETITSFEKYKIKGGNNDSGAKKGGDQLLKKNVAQYNFEKFSVSDICNYNPDNCNLPKHRKLSETEKLQLFSERNLEISNLPQMNENDMISQYGGFKKGDIIEITEIGFNGPSKKWKCVS